MLVIRLQRTGRKGHAQFRVIVQDSHQSPSSGKVVANLGHYNPHTKIQIIDKEKVSVFLANGAKPSDRVINLLQAENIKLPDWVSPASKKERTTRNPEKLRKNRPAEAVEEVVEGEEPEQAVQAETEEKNEESSPKENEQIEEKAA